MHSEHQLKEHLNQNQKQQSQNYGISSISYAIHMHPMTQLKSPDLLDQAKNSLFEITCQILYAALPLILCFQLNIIPSIINLYLIGNAEGSQMMSAIGLGTVLANIFGFLIIQNMSVGFSVICSYFADNKEQIGFMYQKTLGINFFVCIIVTPLLYLSDHFLLLIGFNQHIVQYSTQYIWALVPSFYLFTFYQTTKNYLQSQGVVYPSLVISTIGCFIHFFIANFLINYLKFNVTGAAWATNISMGVNCFILYFYIIKKQPTKESWIEWNICATNNIHKFLWQILTHQFYTYFQALAFQILSIIACSLKNPSQISAYFVLSNTFTFFYFMVMGISQCLNRTFSLSIQENEIKIGKKKIGLGICFIIAMAIVTITNLIAIEDTFFIMFHNGPGVSSSIRNTFTIFLIALLINSMQITLFGIMRTLQLQKIKRISVICFYFIGLGSALIFAYQFDYNLKGIWLGWLVGVIFAVIWDFIILWNLDWQNAFQKVRIKYNMIEQQIRTSKMEISSLNAMPV